MNHAGAYSRSKSELVLSQTERAARAKDSRANRLGVSLG